MALHGEESQSALTLTMTRSRMGHCAAIIQVFVEGVTVPIRCVIERSKFAESVVRKRGVVVGRVLSGL